LQQVNISLGTATQIDHGKTALLKRLTVLSLDSHPHASVEHGTQTFSTCC
jgi:selenocysteine-specific translation elongation factor